ncbi:MAG: hypothetical protein ABSB42_18000 [Tepidisphaeraceae bacterium]
MRLEGDEDQFGLSLCGNVSRGFENPLMAERNVLGRNPRMAIEGLGIAFAA